MNRPGNQWQKWLVCALLAAAVLAVYSRALECAFVEVDDPDYVTSNSNVQRGLNWTSLEWAATTGHAANWHPVTWISHIVDYQFYGMNPLGHHLTNVLLHLANAVLLFLWLNRMTGALWRSAWVAGIFALHPLRVESVVWVAERKDVLSAFFWLLTVGAYLRYAENLKPRISYALALLFFALGLMSKSMLVTLPLVLLLLDYWPLGRLEFGSKFSRRLIVEKIPFLALAAASCVVTFIVQYRFGAVTSTVIIPFAQRLANVPFACARYLGKIFWPAELGPFYGYGRMSFFDIAGATLLVGGISAAVICRRKARPYLTVGWFWFLLMLLPVIGLVQVGRQSMADRYTYLPGVGVSLMAAWGLSPLATARPWLRNVFAVTGVLTVAACAMLTCRQIEFWKTPVAFFARSAETSDQDCQTCYNVGCAVMERGNFVRAERCFERALKAAAESDPPSLIARVHNNLGCALLEQGRVTNAVTQFEQALQIQPRYPQAYYNMGRVFLTNGQPAVAADCFQRALALDENAMVLGTLADAFAKAGQFSQAAAAARRGWQLALAQNNATLAGSLESKLKRYQDAAGGPHP